DEVGQQKAERNDQKAALNDREVAVEDRLDQEPSDAGPGEHGLDHDGAVERAPELQPDDRDDGKERVLEYMTKDDRAVPQSFAASGAHVVLCHRLEGFGSGQPRDQRKGMRGERESRQDQLLRRSDPGRREPPEGDREELDREKAEPERWSRHE